MEPASFSSPPAAPEAAPPPIQQRRTWKSVLFITLAIVLGCCGLTAAATAWWVRHNVYATPMRPVLLSQAEQDNLNAKLATLDAGDGETSVSEVDHRRTLMISAREINACLSRQGLGETVKVDLGDGSLSATLIVPVPEDAPFMAGTKLRLRLALGIRMDANKKFVIQVNDVSLGGVPMPNAWLGDIKGVNLAGQNLEADPALRRFLDGIKELEVTSDGLKIQLNE